MTSHLPVCICIAVKERSRSCNSDSPCSYRALIAHHRAIKGGRRASFQQHSSCQCGESLPVTTRIRSPGVDYSVSALRHQSLPRLPTPMLDRIFSSPSCSRAVRLNLAKAGKYALPNKRKPRFSKNCRKYKAAAREKTSTRVKCF